MAGNKSVILSLLGNNKKAIEALTEVDEKVDATKEKSGDILIGANTAEAQASVDELELSLLKLKEAQKEAAVAAAEVEKAEADETTINADLMDAIGRLGEAERELAAADLEVAAAQDKASAAQAKATATAKGLKDAEAEVAATTKATGDAAVTAGDKQLASGKKAASGAEASEKAWGVTKLAILGVGGGLLYGTVKAAGFSQEMEHLHTQAGVSVGMMGQLSTGVLKLAGQVGQNPDSLAEAAYHVASNMGSMGATSTQMLEAVKVAAEGASVGGASLVDVTNTLGAAIASGMKGTQDYTQAMGALNATVGAGDMTMQDLSDAMGGGSLANAKLYGATLNDVGSILATFGDNNIRGAAAGTEMRMSIQAIAVQASTAKPYLKELGLSVGELGKYQSLHGTVATIDLLTQKMKAAGIASTEQGNVITQLFGKKAGAGIGVLIDQVDRLNSKQKALAAGAGQFGDAWKAQQNTTQQQMKNLEAGSEALAISLGLKLLPAAMVVLKTLNGFVTGLEHGSTGALGLAAVLGTVLGAIAMAKLTEGIKGTVESLETMWKAGSKVAGMATKVVGGLFAQTAATEGATEAQTGLNLAFLASPITWIVIAIVGLVVVIYELSKHSAAFRDFWKAAWHDILSVIDSVFGWVKHNWPLLLGILVGPIGFAVIEILMHWKAIWDGARSALNHVISFFKSLPSDILHALGDLGGLLLSAGGNLIQGLINGVENAAGGLLNTISNLGSKVSSAFKSVMGIFSPSRIFSGHGRDIVLGLVSGIEGNAHLGESAVTRMAQKAINASQGRFAGVGGGSGAVLQVEWVGGSGADQEFISWLKRQIRIRGGDPSVLGR